MNSFFFNSENNDRVYNSESFRAWLRRFFTNGIFIGRWSPTQYPTYDFLVETAEYYHGEHRVAVSPGYVLIKGATKYLTGGFLYLDREYSQYPRIDNIVIEYNENEDTRDIVLKVEKGEYTGSTPYAPTPKRSLGIYQLIIAQVYVPAQNSDITQNDITDCRNDSSKCGYVECTITGKTDSQIAAEFTTYLAAFETANDASFASWFNAMKTTIAGTNLAQIQSGIADVESSIQTNIGTKPTTIEGDLEHIDDRITYLESQGGGSGTSVDSQAASYYSKVIQDTDVDPVSGKQLIRFAGGSQYDTADNNFYFLYLLKTTGSDLKMLGHASNVRVAVYSGAYPTAYVHCVEARLELPLARNATTQKLAPSGQNHAGFDSYQMLRGYPVFENTDWGSQYISGSYGSGTYATTDVTTDSVS